MCFRDAQPFLLKCGKDFKHFVQAASNKYSQNILSIKQIIILSINYQKTDAHDNFPKLLLIHAAWLIRQTVQSLKIRKEANNHIGETFDIFDGKNNSD